MVWSRVWPKNEQGFDQYTRITQIALTSVLSPKRSGWLINQLGWPQFYTAIDVYSVAKDFNAAKPMLYSVT